MTAGSNRNADLDLADVLSREVEKTPSGELLAEAGEDFGNRRALAKEFDTAFARAIARERRRRISDWMKAFLRQVFAPLSWKPAAGSIAALAVVLVVGGVYVIGPRRSDTPAVEDQAKFETHRQAGREADMGSKRVAGVDGPSERPKDAQAGKDDCHQDHDLGLAINACSKHIASHPDDARAYRQRGLAYSGRGWYERAIADFDEAVRLARDDGGSYAMRGAAHWLKGDLDRAIADATEAIRLESRDAASYRVRGFARLGKGEFDLAIADFTKAIELAPTDLSYSGRGYVYFKKGDFVRAVDDLGEAITLEQSSVPAHAWRGEVREAMGERNKAIEDYNTALALPAKTKWESDLRVEVTKRLAALRAPAPGPRVPPPVASLGRRVALVIGNAIYKVGPLRHAESDAEAVAEALEKQLKFDKVTLKLDLGADRFRAALFEFARDAAGADLAVVYFAGLGTEVDGRNYLIPADAALAKAGDVDLEAIALDTVLAQLDGARTLKLVILDTCHGNPFPLAGAIRANRGLGRIDPGENTLVFYAAKDGTTADCGAGPNHSPFTASLLNHLTTPGLELRLLLDTVSDDVLTITGRVQQPHVYGTLGPAAVYLRP